MTSPRIAGWEERLAALMEEARTRAYVLGEHDCFRLACRVQEALVGVDRWPEFSGYTTKREAMRLLAQHGATAEDAWDWFFGVPRADVRMARRGDICLVQTPDGEKHLGVCLGAQAALLGEAGLVFLPTLESRCAWRIG